MKRHRQQLTLADLLGKRLSDRAMQPAERFLLLYGKGLHTETHTYLQIHTITQHSNSAAIHSITYDAA